MCTCNINTRLRLTKYFTRHWWIAALSSFSSIRQFLKSGSLNQRRLQGGQTFGFYFQMHINSCLQLHIVLDGYQHEKIDLLLCCSLLKIYKSTDLEVLPFTWRQRYPLCGVVCLSENITYSTQPAEDEIKPTSAQVCDCLCISLALTLSSSSHLLPRKQWKSACFFLKKRSVCLQEGDVL